MTPSATIATQPAIEDVGESRERGVGGTISSACVIV